MGFVWTVSLPGILNVQKCLQNWRVSTQWMYANNEVWYVDPSLNYLVLLVFLFLDCTTAYTYLEAMFKYPCMWRNKPPV